MQAWDQAQRDAEAADRALHSSSTTGNSGIVMQYGKMLVRDAENLERLKHGGVAPDTQWDHTRVYAARRANVAPGNMQAAGTEQPSSLPPFATPAIPPFAVPVTQEPRSTYFIPGDSGMPVPMKPRGYPPPMYNGEDPPTAPPAWKVHHTPNESPPLPPPLPPPAPVPARPTTSRSWFHRSDSIPNPPPPPPAHAEHPQRRGIFGRPPTIHPPPPMPSAPEPPAPPSAPHPDGRWPFRRTKSGISGEAYLAPPFVAYPLMPRPCRY